MVASDYLTVCKLEKHHVIARWIIIFIIKGPWFIAMWNNLVGYVPETLLCKDGAPVLQFWDRNRQNHRPLPENRRPILHENQFVCGSFSHRKNCSSSFIPWVLHHFPMENWCLIPYPIGFSWSLDHFPIENWLFIQYPVGFPGKCPLHCGFPMEKWPELGPPSRAKAEDSFDPHLETPTEISRHLWHILHIYSIYIYIEYMCIYIYIYDI